MLNHQRMVTVLSTADGTSRLRWITETGAEKKIAANTAAIHRMHGAPVREGQVSK